MSTRAATLVALVDPGATTTAEKHAVARNRVLIFSRAALPVR